MQRGSSGTNMQTGELRSDCIPRKKRVAMGAVIRVGSCGVVTGRDSLAWFMPGDNCLMLSEIQKVVGLATAMT